MPARLIITLGEDGSIHVDGPIDNKVVAYAMLENARDAIKDYNDKKAASQILVAPAGSIPPAPSRTH